MCVPTSSFGALVLRRDRISVLVFDDLREHAVDLVLKSDLELLLHGHVQVVLLLAGGPVDDPDDAVVAAGALASDFWADLSFLARQSLIGFAVGVSLV